MKCPRAISWAPPLCYKKIEVGGCVELLNEHPPTYFFCNTVGEPMLEPVKNHKNIHMQHGEVITKENTV